MARAGSLKDRARFERLPVGAGVDRYDEYGNPAAAAWAELMTVWADLRETPGKERLAAGRLEAPVSGTLRIRASTGARAITAADRVQIRGATWAIRSAPIEVDRGRLLEMIIERGAGSK